MLTPFDEKSRLARTLDRVGLRAFLLLACLAVGLWLYQSALPALLGGAAMYAMCLTLLHLWARLTLRRREATLRERVGGTLALETLTLMDAACAHAQCARYLAAIADFTDVAPGDADGTLCTLDEKRLLIRCDLCPPGEQSGQGAVLAAQRARTQKQADRAVLCTTTNFDARAAQLAEQLDPPVRLVNSSVLRSVAGRIAPATDDQLVALGKKRRSPFSWPRLKPHIFSPEKLRRYLLYAFALLLLYLLTQRLYYLIPAILCFLLALISHRAGQQPFRL